MMTLSTIPVQGNDENLVEVFWSTGFKNNGVVKVTFDSEAEDKTVVAELIAIRFLAFTKKVFGRKPISGNGYELRVFSGAIKKIAQKRSTKQNIVPYGLFLNGSMHGVKIQVTKQKTSDPLFVNTENHHIDHVDARDNGNLIPQELWETAIGTVYITRHAIDQYEARLNARNRNAVSNAELSFFRAIGPDKAREFYKVGLNDSVLECKNTRYGEANVEVWVNPYTGLQLTVIKKDNAPSVLVTSYYRN